MVDTIFASANTPSLLRLIASITITICISLLANFTNSGTYGSDSSTGFRIVQGGTFGVDMTNESTEARGPLSKILANAMVRLAKSGRTVTIRGYQSLKIAHSA